MKAALKFFGIIIILFFALFFCLFANDAYANGEATEYYGFTTIYLLLIALAFYIGAK